MKNITLPRIQNMSAYVPPENGRDTYDGLLLDFNERTIPIPVGVVRALSRSIRRRSLSVYPEYGALISQIAAYADVPTGSILLTNGSDQAISLIFRMCADTGDTVIIPEPSFSMFYQAAAINGCEVVTPSYRGKRMTFPLMEILRTISRKTRLVVICNPNNPTGTTIPLSWIRKIAVKATNAVLLVDEAYAEFSGVSAASLISDCPNILITRTFSKAFGLAALRIGYIIADPSYINELRKIRGPYDVNLLAATAASAVLTDLPSMKGYVQEVMKQSKPMLEKFCRDNRIPFYPSNANFLLIRPKDGVSAERILRENGILVRLQNKPGITGTLRVSIGTLLQTKQFIRVYTRFVLKAEKTKKYAFIDRDGTIIFEPQDTFQVDTVRDLIILPGVITTLKNLIAQGYTLVMVTNQDGLGTPANPVANFRVVQQELLRRLQKAGIVFENVYICPHLASDNCACRKPKTGLLKKLIDGNRIDKTNSLVIGDRQSDNELAQNMRLQFIPIPTNGNMTTAFSNVIRKENI